MAITVAALMASASAPAQKRTLRSKRDSSTGAFSSTRLVCEKLHRSEEEIASKWKVGFASGRVPNED